LHLRRLSIFWYPLSKAATFGLLGKAVEGRKWVMKLLKMRPDFKSKGRTLIERYIKFESIEKDVILGLKKAEMSIE
jgi:hypothetical protein